MAIGWMYHLIDCFRSKQLLKFPFQWLLYFQSVDKTPLYFTKYLSAGRWQAFFENLILVVQLIWHISRYGKTGRLLGSLVAPLFHTQGYQQDQASLWSLSLIIRLKNPDSRCFIRNNTGLIPILLFLLVTGTLLRKAAIDRGVWLATSRYGCRYRGVTSWTLLEGS